MSSLLFSLFAFSSGSSSSGRSLGAPKILSASDFPSHLSCEPHSICQLWPPLQLLVKRVCYMPFFRPRPIANLQFLVARIAYQASDVVLSVQPSLRTDSLFSKSLKTLKANKTGSVLSRGTPEVGAMLYSEL